MSSLPPNYVRVTCDDPKLNVVALLGEEPARLTGGFGGWEVSARPRQVGMTTWTGVEPLQLELSLLLDGWASATSQENAISDIVTCARGDDNSPPGIVELEGVPLPVERWVIEDVAFGDVIVDPASRERLRQALALTLREYVPPEYLQQRRRAVLGSKGKTRVVTARQGDTPAKIARRLHCKWTDLRELNSTVVKKANQALKKGAKLRAPVVVAQDRKSKTARASSRRRSNR
jgi:hypothetical protein